MYAVSITVQGYWQLFKVETYLPVVMRKAPVIHPGDISEQDECHLLQVDRATQRSGSFIHP